ncbi:MAG: ferritin-like domain-containing protein [Dehalococcoidia bacterium]|nr:ferritin-like domain-containing protein [Dehalococcoidia bacterium]
MTIDLKEGAPAQAQPLDLSWLDLENTWGVRAKPGRRGLTLEEIEIGPNAPAPTTDNQSARTRGALRRSAAPRVGHPYTAKSEVWAANAAMLYEEAVQRQWSSATDIPWETLQPLPDDMERAMCQLCTFLTEIEFIAGDVPGMWLPEVNSEYHEIKLFLLTQIMDEARHLDVFRKRAFANGGGLLSGGPGLGLRAILESTNYSEMSALMHVLAEGFIQSVFRMGEYIAQNEAEKRIFRLCAQDESRHVAYGVMHLKYLGENEPERREEVHYYLDRAEGVFSFDDSPAAADLSEALAILMAGGLSNLDRGIPMAMAVRRKQVNEYMHRLDVAGFGDRRDRMHPLLKAFLDPPRN